ncbi:MAG TPA: methylated-DNA--[protein]-cysteine S-methyltransferase [Solirubrobacterales bacterium]|jgi:methylated-DNA-[protein]-cysteine S-methyltransferase
MSEFMDRLVARADTDGLLDVAYATLDTPLGTAMVAATPRGLVRVALPNEDLDRVLTRLAADVSPRLLEFPARLDEARRELEEYFEHRRDQFELPLDWRLTHAGFYRRVLRATARVPFGEVITYGDAAKRAGSPRAVRAAGTALGSNPIPIVVPCHRVIRSGGAIGNYGGGPEMKRFLLELEGALS